MNYTLDYLISLIKEFCKLPTETEWIEFKLNKVDAERIGENMSALANSAALVGKVNAYIIWGIDDDSHEIIGTTFNHSLEKRGNEELESWLLRLLSPKINFRFYHFEIEEKPVTLLEIKCATSQPVSFMNQEYVRIGSCTRKLKDCPEKERELWRIFDRVPYERGIALSNVSSDEVLLKLDFPAYFDLLNLPLPDGRNTILESLEKDDLIVKCDTGNWNITKLGAILIAKKLDEFPDIKRKALRIVHYKGRSRYEAIREHISIKGYANGFHDLIDLIMATTPSTETIKDALRETKTMFPKIAVREIVANALIHQDFFVTGTGPMVEIFDDRMEITNPGMPLIETLRFVDSPPKSRNEILASIMRRFNICEERGSGIDKVVIAIELSHLPAPEFEQPEGFTRVTLFAHKPLSKMDKRERIKACYLHASLRRVMGDYLTNASLRKRFGIEKSNKSMVSRYIRETSESGLITPYDKEAPAKLMKYLPYWARL